MTRGVARRRDGDEQRRPGLRLHEGVKVVEDVHVVGPTGGQASPRDRPRFHRAVPRRGLGAAPSDRFQLGVGDRLSRDRETGAREVQARGDRGLAGSHGGARERPDPRRPAAADDLGHPACDGQRVVEGRVDGARQGCTSGETGPPDQTVSPSVPGVETRVRRIDLREPARDRGAEAAELEHPVERRPAGDFPDGLHPARPARRLEGQAHVHAVVPDAREIHQDRSRRAATAAARYRHVPPRQRVPDHVRVRRDRQASADDRLAALALVHREIDALTQESSERRFQAVQAYESFEVAVLAADVAQQATVDTRGVPVDRVARQREKSRLPLPQAPRQLLAGLSQSDGVAEQPNDGPRQPGGDPQATSRADGSRLGGPAAVPRRRLGARPRSGRSTGPPSSHGDHVVTPVAKATPSGVRCAPRAALW